MELLESERRILSPGCCTEEREKGREGEERGRKREITEDHASCNTTVSFREEEKSRQERGRRERERDGRASTEIKPGTKMKKEVLLRTDGGRAQRERWTERERAFSLLT